MTSKSAAHPWILASTWSHQSGYEHLDHRGKIRFHLSTFRAPSYLAAGSLFFNDSYFGSRPGYSGTILHQQYHRNPSATAATGDTCLSHLGISHQHSKRGGLKPWHFIAVILDLGAWIINFKCLRCPFRQLPNRGLSSSSFAVHDRSKSDSLLPLKLNPTVLNYSLVMLLSAVRPTFTDSSAWASFSSCFLDKPYFNLVLNLSRGLVYRVSFRLWALD